MASKVIIWLRNQHLRELFEYAVKFVAENPGEVIFLRLKFEGVKKFYKEKKSKKGGFQLSLNKAKIRLFADLNAKFATDSDGKSLSVLELALPNTGKNLGEYTLNEILSTKSEYNVGTRIVLIDAGMKIDEFKRFSFPESETKFGKATQKVC